MKSLFFIVLFILPTSVFAQEKLPALIKVSSYSEKSMEPNIIIIDIRSWGRAPSAAKAQEQAAKELKKIKDLFEKNKIKKDDIRTSYFNTQPEYNYDTKIGSPQIEAYKTEHTLVITVKNIEIAGNLLDQLVQGNKNENFGTYINSINWDSDKKAKAEAEAIGDAIRISRERAELMAKATNVKIIGVYQISNQQYYSHSEISREVMSSENARFSKSAAPEVPTQLQPGKIKIRADVSIEYYIKN